MYNSITKSFSRINELVNLLEYDRSLLENTKKGLSIGTSDSNFPRMNILENETAFVVELGLSGWKKDELKLELNGDNLVISGATSTKKEEEEGKYLRRELMQSKFYKNIPLGQGLDRNNIEAKYEDGLLTVTVPKLKKGLHTPTQIEIK